MINPQYYRYKIEFDLFGYSPDEYIAMGKPDPEDVTETSPKPAARVGETSPKPQVELCGN